MTFLGGPETSEITLVSGERQVKTSEIKPDKAKKSRIFFENIFSKSPNPTVEKFLFTGIKSDRFKLRNQTSRLGSKA